MHKIVIKSGEVILLDYDDFIKYWKYPWMISGWGYAACNFKGKTTYLHALIRPRPKGMSVDHINCNKLDNRKENLRICSKTDNNRNANKPSKHEFRGVAFFKNRKKPWVAQIKVNYKRLYLGYYATIKEAALAYNEAAKKYHGEFAILNEVTCQLQ